jgi:hypothetical protein
MPAGTTSKPSIEGVVSRIRQISGFTLMFTLAAWAQASGLFAQFPPYMTEDFDYATFTRFDAPAPPKTLIYQSNGYLALQENGFGGQRVMIPVSGPAAPTNETEREFAIGIGAPVLIDSQQHEYRFADSAARRDMTYFADRTVYRAQFEGGPEVTLSVYPVYGKAAAVFRFTVVRADGPMDLRIEGHEDGFRLISFPGSSDALFASSRWPYRILLSSGAAPDSGSFHWKLKSGDQAALIIASGSDEQHTRETLAQVRSSSDLLDGATHKQWNKYLSSVPLVAPANPIQFTIGTTGQHESITPVELVRSELWFWRGLLNSTCQVDYLPACPMPIADWNVFVGMWSNDGIAEVLSMIATNRSDLARGAILNWFRYSVNIKGDGTAAWTVFPSGKNTFQAAGPERETQGVPVQATLVGEYVRLTGDTSILREKLGGPAGDRTLWQALLAYQENLLKVRDANQDHLIDWMHTYETGWDDKNSPFIDLKGHYTSSLNEQADNLWSLKEMAYLARLQAEDSTRWELEYAQALAAVHDKLWDPASQRYWDLDVKTGELWTKGENLDAYFLLYFETDRARIDAMMHRLRDPQKFDGALLPTMAFDTPNWGGYWRGPAWPRIFCYVAMALNQSGHGAEGFEWLARAIDSNLGPLLPETVDPKVYPPGEHAGGSVRIMGYDALDTMLFPEVAGLRTWGGNDLIIAPGAAAQKVYVRGQKWMGDRYDAIFEPGRPTQLWRNEQPLPPLASDRLWRAKRDGQRVLFEPLQDSTGPEAHR